MSGSIAMRRGDHPRSRGVYVSEDHGVGDSGGSSPLARGLLSFISVPLLCHRIIPARAGFTRDISWKNPLSADHPRSRGVYRSPRQHLFRLNGSSPLARGLQDDVVGPRRRRGIIPARAGFTSSHPGKARTSRDHPRSRGVYLRIANRLAPYVGSSPLARGLQFPSGTSFGSTGIIPARAGFTTWRTRTWRWLRDHPRSRGVYPSIPEFTKRHKGSSPLARGLLPRFLAD